MVEDRSKMIEVITSILHSNHAMKCSELAELILKTIENTDPSSPIAPPPSPLPLGVNK